MGFPMAQNKQPEKNPSVLGSPYSALSVARAVWKNKALAIGIWLAVTALTVLVVRRMAAIYSAETLILVESQKIPEKLVASTVNAELQDRIATIREEVLSSTRLQSLIDKYDLYKERRKSSTRAEIIDMMRKDTRIELERGWTRNQPGAFRVSYQGPRPETVAAVVNEIANFFIQKNLQAREEQATGTSDFLKSQLAGAKKTLEEQELKLSEYKRAHPGELPQQENSLLTTLGALRTQLQGNQDAVSRAQANKAMADNTLTSSEATLLMLKRAVSQGSSTRAQAPPSQSNGGAQPSKESDILRPKLAELRSRYLDSYPDVKEMKERLEQALRAEREQQPETARIPPPGATGADTRNQQKSEEEWLASLPEADAKLILGEEQHLAALRAQQAAAAKELEARSADRQAILAEIASCEARISRLPIREQEMAGIERDYQISKANYEQILKSDFSANMATDMEKRQKAEQFTVLDPARIPEKPAKPMRLLWYAAGTLFGLLLSIAAVFIQELRRNVILGEWELSPDITVLGRIPRLS
jgi:protein tyrosine kinase modulator